MAKFQYRSRTKEGELQVGFVEALSREEATSILSSHGLFVIFIDEVKKQRAYGRFLDYVNRVKAKDMLIFTRQFATLLGAKVPLSDTLITLKQQTKNITLKNVIAEIAADVDAGLSVSQSMEKYGRVFSSFYVNMVRSAEVTGRVEEAVNFLADYIEKQYVLLTKVRNALIYPVVMIGLFLVVGGIMVVVVFPQIGPIFEEAGVELPIFTRVLIGGGIFLARWWWAVLLVLISMILVTYDYLRTKEGKSVLDELILRVPVARKLLKELYVARFAESLSVLIKGGIPIAQAIEITGITIGSAAYSDVLQKAAMDIRRGETLSQSIAKQPVLFPPLVSQMTAVGESTGRLSELLEKISQFYTREVEGLVNGLVELIQPILLLIIGVLVGGLFASILIPIYNLAQTF
jgi:type II secretory pathway component PulF